MVIHFKIKLYSVLELLTRWCLFIFFLNFRFKYCR